MQIKTMNERRQYWQLMLSTRTAEEIEAALLHLPANTYKVLHYHYFMKYSFEEIVAVMQRSITTVRNHHNRGIYLLAKYFGDYTLNK